MKPTKILNVTICVLSLLGSLAFAAETNSDKATKDQKLPACCEKAKAEGKECAHKCCITARKEGKVCDKCPVAKDDKNKGDKKEDKKA